MTNKKEYTLFYIRKKDSDTLNKENIYVDDEDIIEEFIFFDYDSTQTIRNLKEYFLSNFGHKYNFCFCQLYLLKLTNDFIEFRFLSFINEQDSYKLSKMNLDELYLLKKKKKCDCGFIKNKETFFIKKK